MKTRTIRVLGLLLALMPACCGGSVGQEPSSDDATESGAVGLSGLVVDAAGKPIVGALVRVWKKAEISPPCTRSAVSKSRFPLGTRFVLETTADFKRLNASTRSSTCVSPSRRMACWGRGAHLSSRVPMIVL